MSLILILLIIPFPGVLTSDVMPILPNIGYLLRGYHLYEGNPLAMQVTSDPGFQNLIFDPQYSRNIMSGDYKYVVPDGTQVYPKEGCTQAFNNELIQSSVEYQSLLKDIVKTNYTGFDHSFRGSSDFQELHSIHDADHTSQTLLTQIICVKYEALLDISNPPPVSSMFVAEVRKVYATYQRNMQDTDSINQAIHKFLNSYGTHFVRKIELGSRFFDRNSINSNHRYSLNQAGIDMKTGAILSMTRKMGHQLTEEELSLSREFESIVSGSSGAGGTTTTTDNMSVAPIPLYYEIERLDELFSKSWMKSAGIDYKKFRILLEGYFENYCELETKYSGEERCPKTDPLSALGLSQLNFMVSFPEPSGTAINSLLWREKLPEMKEVTISWWMRAHPYTGGDGSYRHIISYNSHRGMDYLKILASPEEDGGCLQLELDGQLMPHSSTCFTPFDDNFHHYVIVWSGRYGRWQIYIDGNLFTGGSANRGFVLPAGGYLAIGQQHDAGTLVEDHLTAFRGDIAYLNIWDFTVNGVEARRLAERNGVAVGNVVDWDQDKFKFNGDDLDISVAISNDMFLRI